MNVLVWGFYGKDHSNLGDELFKEAFKLLFPAINFTFTDNISEQNLIDKDAVFLGGGSFLTDKPAISDKALEIILSSKKIFYIGIGAETSIHPIHQKLIEKAKLIALRSPIGRERINNSNIIIIPDLVYSLYKPIVSNKTKSILVIPNIMTVPNNSSIHWKYNSWNNFKFEFSQFLDLQVDSGYELNFFSMCNSNKENDEFAAYEIINSMTNRNKYNIYSYTDYNQVIDLFSRQSIILSQRFHGNILAELARTSYVSLWHHDKLKSTYLNEGIFQSFYEISKSSMVKSFSLAKEKKLSQTMSISLDNYDELKLQVSKYI